MKKKFALTLVAFVAVAAGVAGLSAFEAHVINVTAKIENALAVSTEAITFGTVFPQERLEQPLRIALSESFIDEPRVDDVNYIIRQKPKCGVTTDDGETLVGPTWTGHVVPGAEDSFTIDCEQDRPENVIAQPNDLDFYLLPSLCEYISKEGPDENDGDTPSFHQPFEVVGGVVQWLDTNGRLAKSESDTEDTWTIDLAVPCFGDHCAQDWEDFVGSINPSAVAADYVLDQELEHKIFGCNLWIEVNGVSETPVPEEEELFVTLLNTVDPLEIDLEVLPSTVSASTTYEYSTQAISSSSSSIPTVQWKITIDGSSALVLGDVHVDERGWKDPDETNVETFHYPMTVVGGNLVAEGSCASPDPEHSDSCTVDDFDVDPLDNFTNVDSIHFAVGAPSGTYTIKRQLIDTETGVPLSNELTVGTVTLP